MVPLVEEPKMSLNTKMMGNVGSCEISKAVEFKNTRKMEIFVGNNERYKNVGSDLARFEIKKAKTPKKVGRRTSNFEIKIEN